MFYFIKKYLYIYTPLVNFELYIFLNNLICILFSDKNGSRTGPRFALYCYSISWA